MIPYGRQSIDESDVAAVASALRSPWLTTGPLVGEFEEAFAKETNSAHAVAFSNGTAALHGVMHALGVGPGDEVIVPANTFVASANCVVYPGGTPVFADVDDVALLVDPADVEAKITSRTRGIIAVDYAGQPCEYEALQGIADRHGLFLHADACHALGAAYRERPVGSLAGSSSFSFHPVKPITTGEGGMVTTSDSGMAARLRRFRGHGIASDFRSREAAGIWEYDMAELGHNCRLSDVQCALGLSQLARLGGFTSRRQALAARYRGLLADFSWLEPLPCLPDRTHAYHLFVTRLRGSAEARQKEIFHFLRGRGVGAHVMYRPVYRHSFYQKRFPASACCPRAERGYATMLVLPMFADFSEEQMDEVVLRLRECEAEILDASK